VSINLSDTTLPAYFSETYLFKLDLFHTRLCHRKTQGPNDNRNRGRIEDVPKRKPGKFSAAKAVKANARERVGQPKPVRVVDDAPRTGRRTKHKPKMDELIQQGE
jgi:hypothetical protein